jgi:hypothetical protein
LGQLDVPINEIDVRIDDRDLAVSHAAEHVRGAGGLVA